MVISQKPLGNSEKTPYGTTSVRSFVLGIGNYRFSMCFLDKPSFATYKTFVRWVISVVANVVENQCYHKKDYYTCKDRK